jgi:methylmalonyl-CoA mutase N-terminal domain/subunit
VNRWAGAKEEPGDILTVDPSLRTTQCEMLARVKARRNAGQVSAALRRLKAAAASTDSLMEPILACVEVYATVGEISDVLREVFGEFTEQVTL